LLSAVRGVRVKVQRSLNNHLTQRLGRQVLDRTDMGYKQIARNKSNLFLALEKLWQHSHNSYNN